MAKEEAKKKYTVLPNNTVRFGPKDAPEEAKAGEEVELTEKEAESMKGIVGSAADYKKAEQLTEAKKLLEDEERAKRLAAEEAAKGKGKQ